MSDLAQECGVSVAHFSRAFRRTTGVAPHQWQLGRRMQRARALLEASTLPIAEIALACGFPARATSPRPLRKSWRQPRAMAPVRRSTRNRRQRIGPCAFDQWITRGGSVFRNLRQYSGRFYLRSVRLMCQFENSGRKGAADGNSCEASG
ncbi:helix-turn-helix transcriptional regulator [Bradyrhizobium japonicum]|uniref:helix-turn-helix transcriptional regulator n=1 Tax=Bradyrhizobium japonicum TaxID=375 RepID=UPI003518012E